MQNSQSAMPLIKSSHGLRSNANGMIKPQRYAIQKLADTSTVKENSIQSEITALETLENKLSQFKLEKVKKVMSQTKVPPMTGKHSPSDDAENLERLKADRSAPAKIGLGGESLADTNFSKKRPEPQTENQDEIDHDEGLRKIKFLTKKMSNYQICDLIQQKNKRNLKREMRTEFSASQLLFLQKKASSQDLNKGSTVIKTSDSRSLCNYMIQLRLPVKLINKEQPEVIPGVEVKNSKIDHDDVFKFPFKTSGLEEAFKVYPESKALPKVIEPISKMDIVMRVGKLSNDRLGSHECHLCFNLALSFERDGDFEKV